ncbi:hypothetical protein ACTP13_19550 [Paenibacillus peoriae]
MNAVMARVPGADYYAKRVFCAYVRAYPVYIGILTIRERRRESALRLRLINALTQRRIAVPPSAPSRGPESGAKTIRVSKLTFDFYGGANAWNNYVRSRSNYSERTQRQQVTAY